MMRKLSETALVDSTSQNLTVFDGEEQSINSADPLARLFDFFFPAKGWLEAVFCWSRKDLFLADSSRVELIAVASEGTCH